MIDDKSKVERFLKSDYFVAYLTYQLAYIRNDLSRQSHMASSALDDLNAMLLELENHSMDVNDGLIKQMDMHLTTLHDVSEDHFMIRQKSYIEGIYRYMMENLKEERAFLMVAILVNAIDKHIDRFTLYMSKERDVINRAKFP